MWEVESLKTNPALRASADRRKLAACASLPAAIKHAISKARGELVEVEAAHMTDRYSDRGAHFQAAEARMGRCERGHAKDQGLNAARNVFASRAEAVVAWEVQARSGWTRDRSHSTVVVRH